MMVDHCEKEQKTDSGKLVGFRLGEQSILAHQIWTIALAW